MADCACKYPIEAVNPRAAGSCEACGRRINPDWTSNDKTLSEFMDRLAEAMFPYDSTGKVVCPDEWETFRIHIEARELAGRPKFRNGFLARDNCREGQEEAVDLALYACLDTLVARREGREDEDIGLALIAAQKAYQAYETLIYLRHKRQGTP